MSKYAEFFNGVDLKGTEIKNFKPEQVSTLPTTPFVGQIVFLDTVDGGHDANITYQWDGSGWRSITHTELTVAPGSSDYVEINNHELSVKALLRRDVVVDETYGSLEAWITGTGYDGSQLQTGDTLFLMSTTDGVLEYFRNSGTTGDSTDFTLVDDSLTDTEIRSKFNSGTNIIYNPTNGSFDIKNGGVNQTHLSADILEKINDGVEATIGDGTTSLFTITHNLGTQKILVGVSDASDDFKEISPSALDCRKPTINTITLDFGSVVPAANQYQVVIKKLV